MDEVITISHLNAPDVLQACTGLRYIVGPLADPAAWNNEGHNRTIYGIKADGKLLALCTEGAYPNQGPTLQECREFMIAHGAVLAADFGGGGDVTAFDRQEGLLIATQNGTMTSLPNFMVFTAKESTMAGTAKSTTNSLSMRPLHQVINSSTIISIPIGTVVPVSEIWEAPATTAYNNLGDLWANVSYGSKTGWVGLIHLGNRYGFYTPPVTPPPPADSITVDIAVHNVKVTGDEYNATGIKLTKKA